MRPASAKKKGAKEMKTESKIAVEDGSKDAPRSSLSVDTSRTTLACFPPPSKLVSLDIRQPNPFHSLRGSVPLHSRPFGSASHQNLGP